MAQTSSETTSDNIVIYDPNGAEAAKEAGNAFYNKGEWKEALSCYSKAISLVHPHTKEAATYLKNRAAAYMKLEKYQKVIDDCNAALVILPNDVKALFRRGTAYEKLEVVDKAFMDMRTVVMMEPSNKDASSAAHRLGKLNAERAEKLSSTDNVIREMINVLNNTSQKAEKRASAMDNLGILSQNPGKAEQVVLAGGIEHVAKLLHSEDESLQTAAIRALCSISHHQSYLSRVIDAAGLDTITSLVGAHSADTSRYAIQLLSSTLHKETEIEKEEKEIAKKAAEERERERRKAEEEKIVEIDTTKPESEQQQQQQQESPKPAPAPAAPHHLLSHSDLSLALDALIGTIKNKTVEPKVKFSAFNAILRVVSTFDAAQRFIARGGLTAMLQNGAAGDVMFELPQRGKSASSKDGDDDDEDEGSSSSGGNNGGDKSSKAARKKAAKDAEEHGITSNLRTHVALVLARIHDILGHKEEERFKGLCLDFILPLINSDDEEDNVQSLYAISTLLQASPEIGSWLVSQDGMMAKIIDLSEIKHEGLMIATAEVIALSASDKTRCNAIFAEGFDQLKALYKSGIDRVRARALVGLCKVGTVGEGAPNRRMLAEGSTVNLEKAARRYLVGASLRAIEAPPSSPGAHDPAPAPDSKYDPELRKWAVEGLAYLTLDADVKETLVEDVAALKALFNMAVKEDDKAVRYGIATILVNLTNSQEKAEKMPEMDELRKFAGEKLPEPHPKDAETFVQHRVKRLVEIGIIPAVSNIAQHSESFVTNEMLSRVFLTIATDTANRGLIVRQGGVKALIPLSNKGTPKGVNIAAQALAKVAITMDPHVAFAGQKAAELVRPLLHLCHSENGLQNYEALLALTNLASMNDDLRTRIVSEKGLQQIESLQFEDNEHLQRAATECLCNLMMHPDVYDMFVKEGGRCYERLHLWVLLAGSDDFGLSRAAAGGLAQLSDDAGVCKRIAADPKGYEIIKELSVSDKPEIQHRAMYIVRNMIKSSKEIAAEFVDQQQGLEILMAVQGTTKSEEIKKLATEGLKLLSSYGIIARKD